MTVAQRPWPTAQEITAAQEAPGGFDRNWSCFDLSDCRHTVSSLVELDGWTVEVCEGCGHAEVTCNHSICQWNSEGTLLRCVTCGSDAT